MSEPLRIEGTVDRIIGGIATILVEDEVDLDANDLPAVSEGDRVTLRLGHDAITVEVDANATERRRTEIDERMARLREERSGGRFDGDPPTAPSTGAS